MKNLKVFKTMALFLGLSAATQAAVIPGYYSGHIKNNKDRNDGKVRVMVQTKDVEGTDVSYALLMNEKDDVAALYQIEELEDGTQAWVHVYLGAQQVITTNLDHHATFNAVPVAAKSKDDTVMRLLPTSYGRGTGCGAEIQLSKEDRFKWLDIPLNATRFKNGRSNEITVQSQFLSGRFELSGRLNSGKFILSEVLPKIALIREQALDSQSESGRSSKREVTGMMTVIEDQCFARNDQLRLIEISARDACADDMSLLRKRK